MNNSSQKKREIFWKSNQNKLIIIKLKINKYY